MPFSLGNLRCRSPLLLSWCPVQVPRSDAAPTYEGRLRYVPLANNVSNAAGSSG